MTSNTPTIHPEQSTLQSDHLGRSSEGHCGWDTTSTFNIYGTLVITVHKFQIYTANSIRPRNGNVCLTFT